MTQRQEYEVQLRALFEKEWANIDPFDGFAEDKQIPEPIVAFDTANALVGGLVFTAAKHPSNGFQVAWINAVYVAPDHRRNGIATLLVKAAVVASSERGFSNIYVYTDVPNLYIQQGWNLASKGRTHSVLSCFA